MKQFLLSIFMIFVMTAGPAVHAASHACSDAICELSQTSKKELKNKKHDDRHTNKSDHYCNCIQIISHQDQVGTGVSLSYSYPVFLVYKAANIVTHIVGPLTKPPSKA